MAEVEIRYEWNLPAFHALRERYADECASLGSEIASRCNEAAMVHNTNPEHPSGTYDSLEHEGINRPAVYVRTADARGDLDNMLHSTLVESLYSVKGRQIRP